MKKLYLNIHIFSCLFIFIASGCSTWILQSGKYSNLLKQGTSRQEILTALGAPIETKRTKYDIIDYYQVRGKLPSNESEVAGHLQGVMLSFGVAELIALPITVGMLPRQMTGIHDLHIYYDKSGTYITHSVKKIKETTPNKEDALNSDTAAAESE